MVVGFPFSLHLQGKNLSKCECVCVCVFVCVQVECHITAKQAHVEVLRVHNWIPSPQRFAVCIERKKVDKATTLQVCVGVGG